jgi:hypothetical protein
LAEEMMSQQSFSMPTLTMLTEALKNVAPKIVNLKSGKIDSSSLPCIKTATKMLTTYKQKISNIVTLVGSLGILPQNMVDAFKQMTDGFLKPREKDEF